MLSVTGMPGHFNPRSREGSDQASKDAGDAKQISIHAPVKGATRPGGCPLGLYRISIHAPVKGATYHGRTYTPAVRISIHAPVKGATASTRHNFTIA